MKNYLISELWRACRRPRLYILLAAAAIGGAFLELTMPAALPLAVYFLIPLLPDFVFGGERGGGPLKNTVSHGISRARVYGGKLAAELLLGLLSAAAMALPALLFPPAERGLLLGEIAAALPLWLAGLAVAHLFAARMGSLFALLAYWGLAALLLMGRAFFSGSVYALSVPPLLLGAVAEFVEEGSVWMLLPCAVGWLAAATAAGLLAFSRREIK